MTLKLGDTSGRPPHEPKENRVYKIKGATQATAGYIDLSFNHPEFWPAQVLGMSNTVLLMGDDVCGPAMALTHLAPDEVSAPGEAHGHGSDNFRISLRGEFVMGRERYGPGEFRFQDGWRTYPSDNNSCGPEGGWEFIIMADRRGFRRRQVQGWDPTSPAAQEEIALQHYIAQTFEFSGDLVDADGSVAPGPSALVTTLGPTSNSGKLNGSFADAASWPSVGAGTHAVVSLMGDRTDGPILILTATDPNETAMSASRFGTEVLRIVVAGNCSIDDRVYETGDIRLQLPGQWCGPVAAGADGLHEILILGNRRHADVETDGSARPAELTEIVAELSAELTSREGSFPREGAR